MSHRDALWSVGAVFVVLAVVLGIFGVLVLLGWGVVTLYLLIVPSSWVAPLTIGLAVMAGLAYLACALYLRFRDIDVWLAIVMVPVGAIMALLAMLPRRGIFARFLSILEGE